MSDFDSGESAPLIHLMHYDPRWRQEFQQTRSGVLQSCMGWVTSVEHIGSTAISGLIARPIIDVLAGVEDREGLDESANMIEGLNYRRLATVDESAWPSDGIVLIKPRFGSPTHRVVLTEVNSPVWRSAIAIRDWLRSHPEVAIDFEQAKVDMWKQTEGDPNAYAAGKASFFDQLKRRIDA
ncbi:MAG: GrpB family protein [Planctomycetota bacterium]